MAEVNNNTDTLVYKVYAAARDNMSLTLYALLCHKSPSEVRRLLSHHTEENRQLTTPLIVAALNGNQKVVRMLRNFYDVDIEQVGTVKFDGFIIEGATPLWCSSGAGHFSVVKLLIEQGANVNHSTHTNSTPLRAACFDGQLDIVKFLVNKGADIHIPNKYQNSCLMIAAYKGHGDVVRFLLECGADPLMKAYCGSTALHFAAEKDHLEIVRNLVQFMPCSELFKCNNQGMNALHIASDLGNAEVVEYLIQWCDRESRIDALELLGASYANDKDKYEIDKCYNYLWLAMQERSILNSSCSFLKEKYLPRIKAYNNHLESRTVKELEAIKDEPDALHMEALTIRERILGDDNASIPHQIVFRGAVFADSFQFEKCTALWMRAMELNQKNNRSIAKDLMRFVQVFSQMYHLGNAIDFRLALQVFSYQLKELSQDITRMKAEFETEDEKQNIVEQFDINIHASLYLLVVMIKLKPNSKDLFDMCRAIYQYNKLNLRIQPTGQTPLHMACDEKTEVDDFHVKDVVHLPSDTLVMLLLECGANIGVMDHFGNTALHTIVRYNRPVSDFLTLHNIIIALLDAGAHIDHVNKKGLTPMEWSTTGVAEIILRSRRKLSLKCLTARVIQQHQIPYQGQIPVSLEDFVAIH